MSDRINALTVVLERDFRDDDCESILNAIRSIKGVASVEPNIVDSSDYVALQRARFELREKLWGVLEH